MLRNSPLRVAAAAVWVLGATVLGGCRTLPPAVQVPAAPATTWEQHRAQLQALAHFGFRGRVAVAAGEDGFNAGLRWQQDGPHTQLSLEGPLGVGGASISATGNDLNVVTARGEQYGSDAAHGVLASRLGFDPPLASLRYWILGVPDPAQQATEGLDAQQRLKALDQGGWRIDYTAYTTAALDTHGDAATRRGGDATVVVPSRLTLRRDAVRVRVVVDAWHP